MFSDKDIILGLIALLGLIFGGGAGGFFLWKALRKKAEAETKLTEREVELKGMEINEKKKNEIKKEIIDSITKEPSPDAIRAITDGFKKLVDEHKKLISEQTEKIDQQNKKIEDLEKEIKELREEIHKSDKENEKYRSFFNDMKNAVVECEKKKTCIFFKILRKYNMEKI